MKCAPFFPVKPVLGSIQLQNGQDFLPYALYLESKRLKKLPQRTVKKRQRGLHTYWTSIQKEDK
jgi:hypothetical protein